MYPLLEYFTSFVVWGIGALFPLIASVQRWIKHWSPAFVRKRVKREDFEKKNFIKLKCGISCPESLMPSHVEAALLGWMLSGSVSREAPSAMMSGGTGLRLGLSCDQTALAMRGLSLHQEEVELGLWGSGSSKI